MIPFIGCLQDQDGTATITWAGRAGQAEVAPPVAIDSLPAIQYQSTTVPPCEISEVGGGAEKPCRAGKEPLNPSLSPSGRTPAPVTAAGALVAHAFVRLSAETVEEFRRPPGPACGEPLPSSTLKHAEEQTITALVALGE